MGRPMADDGTIERVDIDGRNPKTIVPAGGLSADYVYRETLRARDGVAGRSAGAVSSNLTGSEAGAVFPAWSRQVPVTVVDTAGERAEPASEAERRGLELGRARVRRADVILRVLEVGAPPVAGGDGELVVWNKIDLGPAPFLIENAAPEAAKYEPISESLCGLTLALRAGCGRSPTPSALGSPERKVECVGSETTIRGHSPAQESE